MAAAFMLRTPKGKKLPLGEPASPSDAYFFIKSRQKAQKVLII